MFINPNKLKPTTYKLSGGFILIELLAVILIIGLLMAAIMYNLAGSREKARDSRRKSDLYQLKSALELYYNDNSTYIKTAGFSNNWEEAAIAAAALTPLADDLHIKIIPNDPRDSGGHAAPFVYKYYGSVSRFTLFASLENSNDSDDENGSEPGGYEVSSE